MDMTYPSPLHNETFIAQHLGVKVKTLQHWRTRGGGPPFKKIGRLVRYRVSDVEAWHQTRTKTSTSE